MLRCICKLLFCSLEWLHIICHRGSLETESQNIVGADATEGKRTISIHQRATFFVLRKYFYVSLDLKTFLTKYVRFLFLRSRSLGLLRTPFLERGENIDETLKRSIAAETFRLFRFLLRYEREEINIKVQEQDGKEPRRNMESTCWAMQGWRTIKCRSINLRLDDRRHLCSLTNQTNWRQSAIR